MFVTNDELSPPFGADGEGALAADERCRGYADDENLDGRWMAWVSDSNTSPEERFDHSLTFYILRDGSVVADDWADLIDGNLHHAIDVTETFGVLEHVEIGRASCRERVCLAV